jgi:type VI secretion system protein ImpK
MAQSFVDTISGQTLNIDISKAAGGARDMAGLATDLFLIVIRMRESEDLGDPASLRKLISYYIDLFRRNCKAAGIPDDAVNEAVYAIVALIDETVLSVPGACRDYWFGRPLQLDLFGDNIAGEEFFNKLQKLMAQAEKKKDVLEIFYLCLSLGFEGRYKIMNPDERAAIMDEAGRKLRRAKIRVSSSLSPHGNRTDPAPLRKKKKSGGTGVFPLWAGAAAAGGVSLAVYLILFLLTSVDLGRVLKIVEQLNLR